MSSDATERSRGRDPSDWPAADSAQRVPAASDA